MTLKNIKVIKYMTKLTNERENYQGNDKISNGTIEKAQE